MGEGRDWGVWGVGCGIVLVLVSCLAGGAAVSLLALRSAHDRQAAELREVQTLREQEEARLLEEQLRARAEQHGLEAEAVRLRREAEAAHAYVELQAGRAADPSERALEEDDPLAGLEDIPAARRSPSPSGRPPPPTTPRSDPDLDSRSPSDIRRVFQANMPALRGCYEKLLREDLTAGGRVTARLQIAADGRVDDVELDDSAFTSGAGRARTVFSTCMTDGLRGLRFSAANAPTRVNYPFVFRAD